MKEYHVCVVCYEQKRYTIKAETLAEAEKRYQEGEYDDVYEGGALNGEIVNEEWEEV